jgi:hypothetical protein
MRDFICAYFGKGSDGEEWTITARGFSSARQAEKHGLYMMPTAGVFGFAVIAENDIVEGWQLRLERSMLSPKDRVVQDDLNTYKIVSY